MHPQPLSAIQYSSRTTHRPARALSKWWKWSLGTLTGCTLLPSLGIAQNYRDIYMLADFVYNTSMAVESLENITNHIQTLLQSEIVSVKNMVLQLRLALDVMLLQHGGLYACINKTCCMMNLRPLFWTIII